MRRILVTGAGGVGGINFVRALRMAPERLFIVGTDYHYYYLLLAPVDVRYKSPRHDDPDFLHLILRIVKEHKVEFIHPQPEVEVEVLSARRDEVPVPMLIPNSEVIKVARDKYLTYLRLKEANVPVPETRLYTDPDIEPFLREMKKGWIRARKGAGGRLSLPVSSFEELQLWARLWIKRGIIRPEELILQEYLPGRDIAWDSLWYKGELIASYARERLAYIFPHLSPSRITGTPTVARIIHDEKVNDVAFRAVKAIDPSPSGFYCVDLKEDASGIPNVTEVNIKAHTTLALWSYAAIKALKLDPMFNMPYLYVKLGLGELDEVNKLGFNIYPEGLILVRHLDAGAILLTPRGEKLRVI